MRKIALTSFVVMAIYLCSFANHVRYIVENNNLFSYGVGGNSVGDTMFKSGREYWFNERVRVEIQKRVNVPGNILLRGERLYMKQYSSWRGIEIGKQLLEDTRSPWSNYMSIEIGTIGLNGHIDGEALRKLEEKLQRQDIGAIEAQLKREPCVNAQWWTKYNWNIGEIITVVPRGGLLVGTLQDAVEIGCMLKAGWNVNRYKDAAGGNNILTIDKHNRMTFSENLVVCGFTGCSSRYYLYNHFLDGSLFNNRQSKYDVVSDQLVGELCFGVQVEMNGIFIMWYGIMRTREHDMQDPSLSFGGLSIGYRQNF